MFFLSTNNFPKIASMKMGIHLYITHFCQFILDGKLKLRAMSESNLYEIDPFIHFLMQCSPREELHKLESRMWAAKQRKEVFKRHVSKNRKLTFMTKLLNYHFHQEVYDDIYYQMQKSICIYKNWNLKTSIII